MLVRKCDVCNHIIGNEDGYMIDIFKTSMPIGTETRNKRLNISIEVCSECKEAMSNALNKRMSKYVIVEKTEEAKK